MGEKRRLKKKGLPVPESDSDSDDDAGAAQHIDILAHEDMPEGAEASDKEEDLPADDPHAALNIDLDSSEAFQLPQPSQYDAATARTEVDDASAADDKKKRKKNKKKKKKSSKSKDKAVSAEADGAHEESSVTPAAVDHTEASPEDQTALDSWLDDDDKDEAEPSTA